jgi:hypothetical protein
MMRRVLLFALTFLPVPDHECSSECIADFQQSLTATYPLPQFVPPLDLQGLFEPVLTKPAKEGKGCCPRLPELTLSWLLAMLADVPWRPVERETSYCLLRSVGEAKKQQFPQSVQMQAWIAGLRVLESNLLHWLYLPLAR